MRDYKQEVLRATEGWFERLKIKTGWESLPAQFLCRNLQEFAAERDSIPLGSTVLLPRLFYFQNGEGDFNKLPILLKDESGQMDAMIHPYRLNCRTGRPIGEDVSELSNGETIYLPVLMNGFDWPYQPPDERTYLDGFEIRRNRGSDYRPSLAQRVREAMASKPALEPIPVRR